MTHSIHINSKPFNLKVQDSKPGLQYKDYQPRQDPVKFKTQLCRNLQSGYCEYGSKCFFAHSLEELQDRTVTQTKLAKCAAYFTNGYCMLGSKCQFSHRDTSPETAANSPKHSRKASRKLSDESRSIFIDLESRRFVN